MFSSLVEKNERAWTHCWVFPVLFWLGGGVFLSLQAQQRITHPQVLCEEAGRMELRRQFEQMGLADTEVREFCLRFAPTAVEETVTLEEPVPEAPPVATAKETISAEVQSEETDAALVPDIPVILDNATISTAESADASLAQPPATVNVSVAEEITPEPSITVEEAVGEISVETLLPETTADEPSGPVPPVSAVEEEVSEEVDWLTNLRWQVAVGDVAVSYYEEGPRTRLTGNQWELRIQRLFDQQVLLGLYQARRLLEGRSQSPTLRRQLTWEQWQFGATLGFDWQGEAGLGLRGGLLGGWEDNRLHYRLEEANKTYFSDDIVNNQGWWGLEFGPRWEFSSNWTTGLRLQRQLDQTDVRYADGSQGRLQPLLSYFLWLEYHVENR